MSTNVSFTGLSLRILQEKIDKESLKEIALFLGTYNEEELTIFDNDDFVEDICDTKKGCWRIYRDYNGVIGLIFLIDNEYRLAEKIVFLQSALDTANKALNEEGMFGVLPSSSVSFRDGQKHHKKVRNILNNI